MKSAKPIVILAAVVFAALSLSAPSAERDETTPVRVTPTRTPTRTVPVLEDEAPTPKPVVRRPSRRPPTRPDIVRRIPPVDPHKDSVILLEAFMVDVKLSALHSLGVPAISKDDDFVTADQIIKLMKTTDAAVVRAGAKVAVGQKNKASTESITHMGRHIGTTEKRRMEYVDVGTSFTAMAEIRDKEKIFVELDFEHSDVQQATPAAMGSILVKNNWSSSVCLKPGGPILVGAIQDKDSSTFLIVTANIKE